MFRKIFTFLLFCILFTGCSIRSISRSSSITHEQKESFSGTGIHNSITDTIDRYTNTSKGGDCSGFISVVNSKHHNAMFDPKTIHKYFTKGRGKSQAIYNYYVRNNKIYYKNPRVGDLVFFVNTHKSSNQNPKITHIGIIRDINKEGKVKFVHNSRGMNKVSFMNLNKKNTFREGKITQNSYITRCSSPRCLASNKFAGYGKVDY